MRVFKLFKSAYVLYELMSPHVYGGMIFQFVRTIL